MKKILLIVVSLALPLSAAAQQRDGIFLAEYSTKDVVVSYNWLFPIRNDERQTPVRQGFSVGYTANFWRNIAWKAGVQVSEFYSYKYGAGLPLGLAWRPGVRSWEDSIAFGVEHTVSNVVLDGSAGQTDRLKEDLITGLIGVLFRRTEFFVGITPGYCFGPYAFADSEDPRRFYLFGDVGMIVSVPIWHLTLNIPLAYHYNFMHNDRGYAGDFYHYFSVGVGLGWLF